MVQKIGKRGAECETNTAMKGKAMIGRHYSGIQILSKGLFQQIILDIGQWNAKTAKGIGGSAFQWLIKTQGVCVK